MEHDHVLEEHAHLRQLLRDVLLLAERARAGNAAAAQALARRVDELGAELHRHAVIEDEQAGPIVEARDAWGAERRKALGEAHAREEEAACCLRTANDLDLVVQRVADIVAALGWEERELLTEDALRPDTVVGNQSDG